jgi:hypothetical protein
MRRALIAILVLLFSSTVYAQTGVPTSWTLRIYATGSTTPQSAITVTAAQVQCNQAPPTGGTQNPTRWVWTDVVNAGRECIFNDATRLGALPDGSYEATAQATNASGTSLTESARAPFTRLRPNPPAVPTGLRLLD